MVFALSNLSYDDQVKIVLTEILNDDFSPEKSLPDISRTQLENLLNDCERQGYLAHKSREQELVMSFMGEEFELHPTTYVTKDGRKFIKEGDHSSMATIQNYHFQNVYGANFGDNGSVTNNFSDVSIDDLKSFIENKLDSNDKEEGHQLVETLETEEIKPGLLKRFDNLVGKYPHLVDLVGKITMLQLFK